MRVQSNMLGLALITMFIFINIMQYILLCNKNGRVRNSSSDVEITASSSICEGG